MPTHIYGPRAYYGPYEGAMSGREAANMSAMSEFTASPKQRKFITDLLEERDLTGTKYDGWTPDWSRSTTTTATQVINFLTTLPKAGGRTPAPVVAPGRYALETEGKVDFYRVWVSKTGRTGLVLLASDVEHPVRNAGQALSLLERISADPREASLRYGREIGSCGVCGRTLTDEHSRAAGIGPVCAEKTGW